MTPELTALADRYFSTEVGAPLEALLTPVSPERPAGESLRYDRLYEEIREARREDDASLPQGTWQHELKRADWARASALCVEGLARRSKDLQLLAWLLEARLGLNGFSGLAPCLVLLQGLCERYRDDLYPQEEGGGQEMRANTIAWINSKLLPRLRQVPITAAGAGREFGWSDWEMAHRAEQSRSAASRRGAPQEEPGVADISAALALTPGDILQERHGALAAAIATIDALQPTLEACFGGDAPSLSAMRSLLADMGGLLDGELAKRGRMAPEAAEAPPAGEAAPAPDSLEQAMADRAQAYAYLAAAADFLMRLEPHSPVPYLVRRAIEWGQFNTVELYEEIFVRRNGQISIFDLLGLKEEGKQR